MSFQIGQHIGDYEVTGILGVGGMGQVYKVRNVISDREEAMKVLLPDLQTQSDLAERFLREIKLQASLSHPNIASLHTATRLNNQLLMFIELLEGQTLEVALSSGKVPIEQAVRLTIAVLRALEYAHGKGIIHRDIKPANVMVTREGGVKLMDFGIAKAQSDHSLTGTGMAIGSLCYMAPEQIVGSKGVDGRCDLYALGATLYEMVTRVRPFNGESAFAVMTAHLEGRVRPPAEVDPLVPPALSQIILKALAKEPGDRFPTAAEFRAALEEFERRRVAGMDEDPASEVETIAVPQTERAAAGLTSWPGELAPAPPVSAPVPPAPAARPPTKAPSRRKTEPRTGGMRIHPADGLEYIWIPPGQFLMGAVPGDKDTSDGETPRHPVKLSKGFWMSRTPVTVEAYERFSRLAEKPMPPEPEFNAGWAKRDHPIVNVSWEDAAAWCAWAGGRLPTEAEWEYAARGGQEGCIYPWGNEISTSQANYGGSHEGTTAVRLYPPNGFGLYDMAGNVWEWVADWHVANFYAKSPETDPVSEGRGKHRVLRGGSWGNRARRLRVSCRGGGVPDGRVSYVGFRCVRDRI